MLQNFGIRLLQMLSSNTSLFHFYIPDFHDFNDTRTNGLPAVVSVGDAVNIFVRKIQCITFENNTVCPYVIIRPVEYFCTNNFIFQQSCATLILTSLHSNFDLSRVLHCVRSF
jgi:hypothetical protein